MIHLWLARLAWALGFIRLGDEQYAQHFKAATRRANKILARRARWSRTR